MWGCIPEITRDCIDMTNAGSTYGDMRSYYNIDLRQWNSTKQKLIDK